MTRIACLGLGAMGQHMALRLASAGHDVVVWNRSAPPASVSHLPQRGCPREAAEGADIVLSVVRDDAASSAVWADPHVGALLGLGKGALAIESSTLSPAWTLTLAERVRQAGAHFLDAPVVGSRPQAEAGSLVHLVGGEPSAVELARPFLAALGSAVHHLGPTPAGATAKLVVNALFVGQVALLAELLGLIRHAGLDPARTLAVMATLAVTSPAGKLAGESMLTQRFAPLFPIELAAKDLDYARALGTQVGTALPLVQRATEVLLRAQECGLAPENLTALAKLYP